jgi:Uma2 family endonuclease
MSMLAKLSVAEYEQIVATGIFDGRNKRRIELICGELRTMNPIGSEHAMMVDRLTAWSFAAAQREKIWVRVQNPLAFLDADSEPEPDVVWAKAKDYAPRHPGASDVLLLIEVADSSLDYDRGEKANLYATAGIREYWIVNLIDRTVEVRRDPHEGHYRSVQSFAPGTTIEPLAIPEAKLAVASLFAPNL